MSILRKHGVILGSALFVLAIGWLFVQPEPHLANKIDLEVIPLEKGPYQGIDIDLEGVPIEEQLAPQAFMFRDYSTPTDRPVTLCLVYNYSRRSRSFHDPWVCYPAQGFALYERPNRILELDGQEITASVVIAEKNIQEFLVVYWYMSGDSPLGDFGGRERTGFLRQEVISRINRDLGVSSMIRVSVPIIRTEEYAYEQIEEFLESFYPEIREVRADIEYRPMPAKALWGYGVLGQLAIVMIILIPAALAVTGFTAYRNK